jgi:hypothetical protein
VKHVIEKLSQLVLLNEVWDHDIDTRVFAIRTWREQLPPSSSQFGDHYLAEDVELEGAGHVTA